MYKNLKRLIPGKPLIVFVPQYLIVSAYIVSIKK